MSKRALESHGGMVRQLQGIYRASGEGDPFLASAFNQMILVSFYAAICAPDKPDRAARHEGEVK